MKIKFDSKGLEKAIRKEAENAIRQGKANVSTTRNCPFCSEPLNVPLKDGSTIQCPNCHKEIEINLNVNWTK
ncbi:hypothetical protein [Cytobacillus firmus]|uniref:Uncharacterized protein n=1 Tax=Cytobacillus firmus TaxID=1399 RepID=A0AA46SCY6_CYTFI|nr:hypothetical protein [Cytobacillus firmus]UYG93216.1 hypothetical protein OD459_13055 [Cytobacillus firmus]